MADNHSHITLSQLQASVKSVLAGGFPLPVWVVAEISELKVNYSSGHCYLELVEKGGANGVPKAKANAVIWSNTYGMLSSYFRGATGQDLAVGMKVLMSVSVTYHELYGLSLKVTDIDPLYTVGDMERQRLAAIAKLQEDGVFDLNRELEMPLAPQRIAVVSSPGAAGYQDFLNELSASGYRFDVDLFEAIMQGHSAEESIIDALSRIADDMVAYDAVVIIRGGGSQSDLSFLNSYIMCFHIAQFPIPVIAGLGHDKDQSVLDMVAAVSLKTPTAVAGYLVQRAASVDAELDMAESALSHAAAEVLAKESQRLQGLGVGVVKYSKELTHRVEIRLERLRVELSHQRSNFFLRQSNQLNSMETLLAARPMVALNRAGLQLDNMRSLVEGRDPQRILSLGFSIVRSEGRAVKDVSHLAVGQDIEITFETGTRTAKITDNGKES